MTSADVRIIFSGSGTTRNMIKKAPLNRSVVPPNPAGAPPKARSAKKNVDMVIVLLIQDREIMLPHASSTNVPSAIGEGSPSLCNRSRARMVPTNVRPDNHNMVVILARLEDVCSDGM